MFCQCFFVLFNHFTLCTPYKVLYELVSIPSITVHIQLRNKCYRLISKGRGDNTIMGDIYQASESQTQIKQN